MIWLCILLGLFLLLFCAAWVCYRLVFVAPRQTEKDLFQLPETEQYIPYKEEAIQMIRNAAAIPYEEIWIQSSDGIPLYGKYYASKTPGAPVQIMMHGYHSSGEHDFCGGMPYALSQGYSVLMVDQRGQGKSGGKCMTFGVKERLDCLAWIDYVLQRLGPEQKILLYGMSMGAATVLMAAGMPLPTNVKGIVADCGYTAPEDILRKEIRARHYPVWLVYPLVRLGGILFGGFDVESASASDAMTHCTVPVCLIHGEDDRFVPCEMSRKNFTLCTAENKVLLTVPHAGHGISYLVDKASYLDTVNTFLKTIGA